MKTIQKLLTYDDHRDSTAENSISVTTLLGPLYKAKKYLNKEPKNHMIDLVLKRSSFIGSACHQRMESALKGDPAYQTEIYGEREITVHGMLGEDKTYTIAGTFDILHTTEDDRGIIMDLKTFYGNKRKEEQLYKDSLQMSIYRWIHQEKNIGDVAIVLAISQSNNYIDEIPVQLLSIEETEDMILTHLNEIEANEDVDCHDGVKYNTCNYCEYECEYRK